MTTRIIWIFSCNHKASQFIDQSGTLLDFQGQSIEKIDHQPVQYKWPKCIEAEGETRAAKDGEEEKARKALAAYQAQSDFIMKQIQEAHDNKELSANLNQILGACQIVWADQVMALETKVSAKNEQSLSSTYTQRFTTAVEKIQLCHGGMNAKRRRLVNVFGSTSGWNCVQLASERDLRAKEKRWYEVLWEMKQKKADFDARFKHNMEELDKSFEKTWAKAVELMKEK
ncbi:hypothetical protein DL95DRAFT_469579 [Leptodontidium sp. 2 PMI_412]|nr:hypothetical protein DL95DRAFT_469579 [Leptodontidium sp. 2 PMI_412]